MYLLMRCIGFRTCQLESLFWLENEVEIELQENYNFIAIVGIQAANAVAKMVSMTLGRQMEKSSKDVKV